MTVGNRAARWAAALLAMLTVAGTAACAGPPSKGGVHGVTLNQSRNNVFILAREPDADMLPTQVVSNFLGALTGDQKDPTFSVAREYLTSSARGKWNPATATTEIVQYGNPTLEAEQSSDEGAHPADASSGAPQAAAPAAAPAVNEVKTLVVKGTEIAQIDPFGFFKYQRQPVSQTFTLRYLGAGTGWRIDVPPDSRMVNPDAFKRAYQTYQSALPVYLPTHGVVPQMDQVYLTQSIGKVEYTYDALARAVLHGRYPSQNTKLALATAVTVDPGGQARVTLQAPPSGIPDITDVQQALVDTFRDASELPQLLSPTPLSGVLVTYAGCSACHEVGVGAASTGAPTAYWVCPQQANDTNAAIVDRPMVAGQVNAPAACPAKTQPVVSTAGIQMAKNAPIAVKQTTDSADVKTPSGTTVVAVVKSTGDVVVLNDKNTNQQSWYTAKDPRNVSDLEWDPVDGSLWVVDAGSLYRVQDPGDKGPSGATQQFVAVPGGTLTRFKPSPDGLRAVVVSKQNATSDPASPGSPLPAAMVTLERTGDEVTLSTDTVFQLLAGVSQTQDPTSPALQSVTDAAWADGRTVVLLGTQGSSGTLRLYRVYLDGSQDSSIPDSEDAQPSAWHLSAVTAMNSGHPSLWTFSDAPSPTDPNTAVSYFKRSGGADSFQEPGWSPVVATVTGD
jgi:hypothetical protein